MHIIARYASSGLCALVCLIASAVSAATLTVTTEADSGAGSLRQAVLDAAPGDVVDFAPTVHRILFASQILIEKTISIQGSGAASLQFDGGYTGSPDVGTQLLEVSETGVLKLHGVTFRRGVGFGGGAMNNKGTADLSDTHFENSTSLPLLSDGPGGGGGAIQNSGRLTVTRSSFVRNTSAIGGAIYSTGYLRVSDSTFLANRAAQGGGHAIFTAGFAPVTDSAIDRSTISVNGGLVSRAVQSSDGAVTALFAPIIVRNSIVYENYTADLNANTQNKDLSLNVVSGGNNVIFSIAGSTFVPQASDRVGDSGPLLDTDLLEAILLTAPNGTKYLPLPPSSPTIDRGDGTGAGATDQIGAVRVAGCAMDIGAIEAAVPHPATLTLVSLVPGVLPGQLFDVRATVTSPVSACPPAGDIELFLDDVSLGRFALVQGVVTRRMQIATIGTHTIRGAFIPTSPHTPAVAKVMETVSGKEIPALSPLMLAALAAAAAAVGVVTLRH